MAAEKKDTGHITIHMKDSHDLQIDFRVKSTTKWVKVLKAYRDKLNLSETEELRFVDAISGSTYPIDASGSLSELGIMDEHRINVHKAMHGGS